MRMIGMSLSEPHTDVCMHMYILLELQQYINLSIYHIVIYPVLERINLKTYPKKHHHLFVNYVEYIVMTVRTSFLHSYL